MDEVPWCFRLKEDEHLFRRKPEDPFIQVDLVSPPIEGYFRLPPVWIGDEPQADQVARLNPSVHHEKVYQKSLSCEITVTVQRDGLFLFDFSAWAQGPMVVIPGYRKPNQNGPYHPTREHQLAEEKAEEFAFLRARVMNVHQVCLVSAEVRVNNRYIGMGHPINASSAHKAIHFDVAPSYEVFGVHQERQIAHSIANRALGNVRINRNVISMRVIVWSLDLLDTILCHPDTKLTHLVETLFVAASSSTDGRPGESLVLAWGVCEQLISSMWKNHIAEPKQHRPDGLSKERREKLTGRDYSASTMIEMLELAGLIDQELYRQLEVVRKARNLWIHQMRVPKTVQVGVCIRAALKLLSEQRGIDLTLQYGASGGVPKWPYWMWAQMLQKE